VLKCLDNNNNCQEYKTQISRLNKGVWGLDYAIMATEADKIARIIVPFLLQQIVLVKEILHPYLKQLVQETCFLKCHFSLFSLCPMLNMLKIGLTF
jgi:hypothetical protein